VSRLFGTDGVRGVANADLTPELAFAIGRAGAAVLTTGVDAVKPIVVGRDTRLSGTMLEAAIVAGITSTGRDVLQLGVVPTPGVAAITLHVDAAAGVMISASHNPIEDNGIKLFGPDGFKLSDALEDEIAARLHDPLLPRPTHAGVGVARSAHGLLDRYAMMLLEAGGDLTGWTVVVDAANGAAFRIAPVVFERLGARVIALNASDDGSRINVECGATDLRALQARVKDEIARGGERVVGVAFDGDADRVKFIDETGAILDGDHTLYILARDRQARGMLRHDTVVSTVMSNVGLERAFAREGITMLRAAVGDRYVLDAMRSGGFELGGEQSGHVIDLGRTTTGDGPMTAVALFAIAARTGLRLDELAAGLTIFPQILINIPVADRAVAGAPEVAAAVAAAERRLGETGRILVRASGTESLVRVMVEAPDRGLMEAVAASVAAVVRAAAGVAGQPKNLSGLSR
jgi:phosphoglucosamine mutase